MALPETVSVVIFVFAMITMSAARVVGVKVDPDKFTPRSKGIRLSITADDETNSTRELSIASSRRIDVPNYLLSAVIRDVHPELTERLDIDDGRLVRQEIIEQRTDFTRVLFTSQGYALFWFRSKFPGGSYANHRLLVARCLGLDEEDLKQQLVIPVRYDLAAVRDLFSKHIWDQNFQRPAPIQFGRIRGSAMEQDPLFTRFSDIKSFIGITIPTVGSVEKVKVLADGRLQFMSWQNDQVDTPGIGEAVLQKIRAILKELSTCELTASKS